MNGRCTYTPLKHGTHCTTRTRQLWNGCRRGQSGPPAASGHEGRAHTLPHSPGMGQTEQVDGLAGTQDALPLSLMENMLGIQVCM